MAGPDVLATLRGKVVVLDFWQPWCEPCRNAMPHMVAAQKTYPKDVQVLGVCKVENYGYDAPKKKAVRPIAKEDYPAHVADFRADMALNYPLAIADTGANSEAYHVTGIPTLVVIDRAASSATCRAAPASWGPLRGGAGRRAGGGEALRSAGALKAASGTRRHGTAEVPGTWQKSEGPVATTG